MVRDQQVSVLTAALAVSNPSLNSPSPAKRPRIGGFSPSFSPIPQAPSGDTAQTPQVAHHWTDPVLIGLDGLKYEGPTLRGLSHLRPATPAAGAPAGSRGKVMQAMAAMPPPEYQVPGEGPYTTTLSA